RVRVCPPADLPEVSPVPASDPGTRDHLGEDGPRPNPPSLPPKSLDGDPGHRGQHEAGRDRNPADVPGFAQIHLHGPARVPRPLAAPCRTWLLFAPVFAQEGALKEVLLTAEGYEKLKQEIEYLQTEKRREVAER